MNQSQSHGRRRANIIILALLLVIITGYAVRLIGLAIFAIEGDVPAASSLHLPDGSTVVSQTTDCASGGCWANISVRPPEGMNPDELSREIGTTPRAQISGNLWDPRTINLTSESRGQLLHISADFWMVEPSP